MVNAGRAAFLIDAAAYFSAFVQAVERAQRSILIVGWDIDSRVRLLRGNPVRESSSRLGDFLNDVVSRRSGLHAHVLIWDFSLIYALEREPLPIYKFGWRTHRRLHFRMDGTIPIGASHHQKIVVIDDAIAFAGGVDLTKCRWDTPDHQLVNPLRMDPGCGNYPPFHDLQMAVDGEAAVWLGKLVRERWRRTTGKIIQPPVLINSPDLWPSGLTPDLENVAVAIARTEPEYNGYPQVGEVRALYEDMILSARRTIYIENQYLTSQFIGELLAARLQEEFGPEVVIVLPCNCSGWLEQSTMGALRSRVLQRLRAADRFGRLRVYCPRLKSNGGSTEVLVHSKVLIVDNDMARVGSSNLSNRSMGLDTECDLAVESGGDEQARQAIARFRNRLVAEHLGTTPDSVDRLFNEKKSLIETIECLRVNPSRSLETIDTYAPEVFDSYLYDNRLLDPEKPAPPAELLNMVLPESIKKKSFMHILGTVCILLTLLGLAAAWRWTPLNEWLDMEVVIYWAGYIREQPFAILWVILVYMIGGLVVFPVTLLMVGTAISFGPLTAFVFSMLGCMASAFLLFLLGQVLGQDAMRRFPGSRLERLSRSMGKRGLFTVLMLRIFPVGPFSVVNFVMGASHISFRDYAIGTLIGLVPGLLAITFLGDRLGEAIRNPKMENFLFLAAIVALFIGANIFIRRWLHKRNESSSSQLHK